MSIALTIALRAAWIASTTGLPEYSGAGGAWPQRTPAG